MWHPFSATSQFLTVYKLHTAHESEKVAEQRRKKLEDVQKRKEFMRAHGIEPGFLTGTWMDRFGTVEGDGARQAMKATTSEAQVYDQADPQSPVAIKDHSNAAVSALSQPQKPKRWLGIW